MSKVKGLVMQRALLMVASILIPLGPVLAEPGRVQLGEPVAVPEPREVSPCRASTLPVPVAVLEVQEASGTRFWFQVDYAHRWLKRASTPPLVTTDPTGGASPTAGGLGDPATVTLLGGTVTSTSLSGVRLEGGTLLKPGLALEVGGFVTEDASRTLAAVGNPSGTPFLFRPFANLDTGNPNAGSNVSLPALLTGGVSVTGQSQVWGLEGRIVRTLVQDCNLRLDAFTGIRYLDLDEKIEILDARTEIGGIGNFGGPPTLPGDRFLIQDRFRTHNQFFGAQLGMRAEIERGRFTFQGSASASLGDTRQQLDIGGRTTLLPLVGGAAFLPGGILALPSNSGRSVRHEFSVVPEIRVQLGYDVTSRLRVGLGYDFLYWGNVVRPATQIVPVASASQLPTSPTYGAAGTQTPPRLNDVGDIWIQGINAFAAVRY